MTGFNILNFLLLCKVCYFRAHILETNDNVTTIMSDIDIKINTLDVVVKLCAAVCCRPTAARPSPAPWSADLTNPHPPCGSADSNQCTTQWTYNTNWTFQPNVFDFKKDSNWELNFCLLWFTYAKISSCLCNHFGNKDFDMYVCLYVCLYVRMLFPHSAKTNGPIFKIQTPIIRV